MSLKNNNLDNNKMITYTIDKHDPYIWCNFILEFRHTWEDLDSLIDEFLIKYPKVLARIEHGDGFFLKKDTQEVLYTRVKGNFNFTFKYWDEVIFKKQIIKKEKNIKLCEILKLEVVREKLPVYSYATFKPNDYKLLPYEYNTWSSFEADRKVDFQMDKVQPVLDFIKDILSNNSEEVYKYLISWFRHIIVKPERKTEVAIFLYTEGKGCGKGTFSSWFREYVIGNHLSGVVSGLNKLTQKHNTCIYQKILTEVEEMPKTEMGFHSQFDTMKHLITDNVFTIEPKGVDPYQVPNTTNFLMMTNNLHALKIENGDRRYACFQVNEKYKAVVDDVNITRSNTKYWDKIHNEVLTEEVAPHFFHYLKTLSEDQCVSLREIPKTDLRDEIIKNSRPPHVEFFEGIKEDDVIIPIGMFLPTFSYNGEEITHGFKVESLYRLYSSFCDQRKFNAMSFRRFISSSKNYIKQPGLIKIDGKKLRFYIFTF